jgi:hypothetical protein
MAVLLAFLLQVEPLSDEAETLLSRMDRVADFLKFDRVGDARRVLDEIVRSGTAKITWSMTVDSHERFVGLAEVLAKAGERGYARAFLVAIAPLCAVMEEEAARRAAALFAGEPEAAVDFVKRAGDGFALKAFGLKPEDVHRIVDRRLEAGTATEDDVVLSQRWPEAALLAKALKSFPDSPAVMTCVGNAAIAAGEPEAAATAYGRALDMMKAPERLDVRAFDRWVPLLSRPIGSPFDLRPLLVRFAVATHRARGRRAAVAAIEKRGAAADLLTRGLAYEQIGAPEAAARAYTTWLREKGPRQTWIVAYAELAMRVMRLHYRSGRPLDGVAAERLLMRSYGPLQGMTLVRRRDCAWLALDLMESVDWDAALRDAAARLAPSDADAARARELARGFREASDDERARRARDLVRLGPSILRVLREDRAGTALDPVIIELVVRDAVARLERGE